MEEKEKKNENLDWFSCISLGISVVMFLCLMGFASSYTNEYDVALEMQKESIELQREQNEILRRFELEMRK